MAMYKCITINLLVFKLFDYCQHCLKPFTFVTLFPCVACLVLEQNKEKLVQTMIFLKKYSYTKYNFYQEITDQPKLCQTTLNGQALCPLHFENKQEIVPKLSKCLKQKASLKKQTDSIIY